MINVNIVHPLNKDQELVIISDKIMRKKIIQNFMLITTFFGHSMLG